MAGWRCLAGGGPPLPRALIHRDMGAGMRVARSGHAWAVAGGAGWRNGALRLPRMISELHARITSHDGMDPTF